MCIFSEFYYWSKYSSKFEFIVLELVFGSFESNLVCFINSSTLHLGKKLCLLLTSCFRLKHFHFHFILYISRYLCRIDQNNFWKTNFDFKHSKLTHSPSGWSKTFQLRIHVLLSYRQKVMLRLLKSLKDLQRKFKFLYL